MFQAGLLLIIRSYYSVCTTIGKCHAFVLTSFWQHKLMKYTNFCIYTVDPPDDEQHACSKHVEVYYSNKLIENSTSFGSYCTDISRYSVNKTSNLSLLNVKFERNVTKEL
jgi:hypothetical protein